MIKRKQGVVGSAILLGGMVLAGCGTSGHPVAIPPRHHSHAVSPSSVTSPSITPSSSPISPSPSSGSVTAPTHRSQTVHPSPVTSPSAATFSSIIQGAMQAVVGNTRVPLYAPTHIEDFTAAPYYSAAGQVSPETHPAPSYAMTFYRSQTSIKPNSSQLHTVSPQDIIGGYQVSEWPSAQIASQHLFYGTPTPIIPPRHPSGSSITLAVGLTGTVTTMDGLSMIIWHEGRWTMAVMYEHASYTKGLATAQNIVFFCQHHFLPPPTTQGDGIILLTGKHTTTKISWNSGSLVVNASDHQGWLGAFETAILMRKYN
ncbi:MAG: hypothetical protein C7B46_13785 [Sulfobacillus benefaciens]|uniref:Uncharacterized protein n=1 Tax=Sulfobacillus benefaciens TaxID=453960 RepID=A0A2T2XDQ6_9FIRM|nr:MAG: hypothetical protein C7B46_13785 [Sulfobacillus benefaciens]